MLPGTHTWAVGYKGVLYTSKTSDSDKLDLIVWHFGSDFVQLKVIDSECVYEEGSWLYHITCCFDNVTSQLTSNFEAVYELTSDDNKKVVKFEAESKVGEDGTKDKTSKEVVITVEGVFFIVN